MKTVSASARALILALAVMFTLSSAACGTAGQGSDPPSYLHEPFSVEESEFWSEPSGQAPDAPGQD